MTIRDLESREKLLLLANPGMLVEHHVRGNGAMELGLNGKTALVTGANRGIGAAIGMELAQEGVHVCLVARDAAAVRGISREEAITFLLSSDGTTRGPRPDEIGAMTAFLASDKADFLQGSIIGVGGDATRSL